jgi:hypothetical protein
MLPASVINIRSAIYNQIADDIFNKHRALKINFPSQHFPAARACFIEFHGVEQASATESVMARRLRKR